jgi:winged helix-turn helix protein
MAPRRRLTLEEDERRNLQAHRDRDPRPYVRERCAAMLKIAEGQSPHWVARQGLLKERDPDTVYRWLTAYQAAGLAGLTGGQQGGVRRRRL